jgi:hypothetical protein
MPFYIKIILTIILLFLLPFIFGKILLCLSDITMANAIQNSLYFATILVALFGKTMLDWWNRPEVKIEFEDNEYPYFADTGGVIWVRAKIANKGKGVAKKCEVRLEKLYRMNADGGWSEVREHFEKLVLPWVGYPVISKGEFVSKEWITRDIARGSDALVDIGYIYTNLDTKAREFMLVTSIKWKIDVKWSSRERKLKFQIIAYGDNFKPTPPKDIIVDVEQILESKKVVGT